MAPAWPSEDDDADDDEDVVGGRACKAKDDAPGEKLRNDPKDGIPDAALTLNVGDKGGSMLEAREGYG
jgi:hypothetical protein